MWSVSWLHFHSPTCLHFLVPYSVITKNFGLTETVCTDFKSKCKLCEDWRGLSVWMIKMYLLHWNPFSFMYISFSAITWFLLLLPSLIPTPAEFIFHYTYNSFGHFPWRMNLMLLFLCIVHTTLFHFLYSSRGCQYKMLKLSVMS